MKQVYFSNESGSPQTAEWHAWRAQGIGASEAAIVAGHYGLISDVPAWLDSLYELWQAKMGQGKPKDVNAAMLRGTLLEPEARAAYEALTGNVVNPVFGEMDKYPFVRASFDGLSFGGSTVMEVKCPGAKNHDIALSGQVPMHYTPQLAHQGLVAWGDQESDWVDKEFHFFSYNPDEDNGRDGGVNRQCALVVVPALKLYPLAMSLLQFERTVWDSVSFGIPPAGGEFAALAKRYVALDDEVKALEAQMGDLKERFDAMLGAQARLEVDRLVVSRVTSSGRIDYSKLIKSLQIPQDQIEACRGKPSTSLRVAVSRPKLVVEETLESVTVQVEAATPVSQPSFDVASVMSADDFLDQAA